MKKFFGVLLALCLLTAVPAAAQLDFGIKAGVNLAQKPSDIDDVKGNTGWFVGPTAKVVLPIVGLGVEANLLYSQTSTEVGGEKIKRQTIDLPLFLRYELSIPAINKFIEPFIAAGPQWSWNIGDRRYTILDVLDPAASASQYTLRSSNLSLNLGAGVILLDHFQIHANYNIALGSTSDYTDSYILGAINNAGRIKSKTNTWQISVAYMF